MTDTASTPEAAVDAPPPAPPQLRFFWFHTPDGGPKFTHLDLTGAEVLELEARLGCEWGEMHPVGRMSHRMAMLEMFLARTDSQNAASRVRALTVKQLEDAVTIEWDRGDDLPDGYEDGLPLAETDGS